MKTFTIDLKYATTMFRSAVVLEVNRRLSSHNMYKFESMEAND